MKLRLPRNILSFRGRWVLNKIYGLVQMGKCLFNKFYDDRFEEPEVGPRVFRKFNDGGVDMVVIVHVDDIVGHAQATIERFAAELEGKFKVKPMVEKFGVEKASNTPASLGVLTLSQSG